VVTLVPCSGFAAGFRESFDFGFFTTDVVIRIGSVVLLMFLQLP
jgi:hypothetical protein